MNSNIASFLNFSKTVKGIYQNSQETAAEYKTYVVDTSVSQANLNELDRDDIRQQYINAIQYVLLNLTTPAERAFYANLDLNNNNNLSSVIPLVSNKLKKIALYVAAERDRAKFSTLKYNLKGSEFGTQIFIKNYIYTLYNDVDFTSRFTSFPSLSSLNNINIGLDYYFEPNYNLYDKDYEKGLQDPELYDGGDYEKLNLLFFNKDLYFPDLSGNVIRQYTALNVKYLKTNNNKYINVENKKKLKIKKISTNIQDLEAKYFLYGEKTEENLIFNIIKDGVAGAQNKLGSNSFLGNNLVYVSGGLLSNPTSGLLVEAAQRYGNLLNYRNYTVQASKPSSNAKTLKQIGGFFLPEKQGLGVSISKHYSYYIVPGLSGLNVTVDPNQSINPRGNSKIEYPDVFNYTENAGWIINNISGQYNWGKIGDIRQFQKLNGYQSYEEANYEYKSGINKVTDSFDFFTGNLKNVWANKDVYPVEVGAPLPLQDREFSYNVTVNDIYRWQGDIYGNNFALYKRINNFDDPNVFNKTYTSNTPLNIENFDPLTGVITAFNRVVYLYRNSTFNTSTQTLSTTPIYDTIQEKYDKDGTIYVRTFNNTSLKTLSDAFSAVFSKYNTATKLELIDKVKDFDIINDVIIIKTENYNVMERFVFNIDEDTFEPYYSFKTLLQ